MTAKGLVFDPLLYQVVERRNQYLIPLNCGTEDADGQTCFAILLECRENNSYRRISNSQKYGFPLSGTEGLGELEFVGRRRICIQHDTCTVWPVLERRDYLIMFRYPREVRRRCIKIVKMVLNQESTSTKDDVVMRLGAFVTAEMGAIIRGREFKFGIVVRRCGESLTLKALLCTTSVEFEDLVERNRMTPPRLAERQDTVELQATHRDTIQIELRPKRGRIIQDPNGEQQRLETMLVAIALRGS